MANNISHLKIGDNTYVIRPSGWMTVENHTIKDTDCTDFGLIDNAKIYLQMSGSYNGTIGSMNINNTGATEVYDAETNERVKYVNFISGNVYEFVYIDDYWHILNYKPKQLKITCEDLRFLCEDQSLVPGMQYRIIDYKPYINPSDGITGQYNVWSMPDTSHTSFDLIVTAITNSTLSHDAYAAYSSWDSVATNMYINNGVDLSKWKIKYDVWSDASKYSWVGSHIASGPAGKIYYNQQPHRFGKSTDYILYTSSSSEYIHKSGNSYRIVSLSFDEFYRTEYTKRNNAQTYYIEGIDNTIQVNTNFVYDFDGTTYYSNLNMWDEPSEMVFVPTSSYSESNGTTGIAYVLTYIYATSDTIDSMDTNPYDCGVIYHLEDDLGNSCPFDFKNIHYYTSSLSTTPFFSIYGVGNNPRIPKDATIYTKNITNVVQQPRSDESNMLFDTNKHYIIPTNRFIIGSGNKCNNIYIGYNTWSNVISSFISIPTTTIPTLVSFTQQQKIENVYIGDSSYNNIISSSNNTLGNLCSNNKISGQKNTLGNNCYSNQISSEQNTFGSTCSYIVLSYGATSNSFGNGCNNISLSNQSYSNSFGNACSTITTGTYFMYNSFGNNVARCYVKQTNSTSASNRNYVRYCRWDDGVSNVYIYNGTTGSASAYVQNVRVARGCNMISATLTAVGSMNGYEQIVQNAASTTTTI